MKKSINAVVASAGIIVGVSGFTGNAHALSWVISPDANALAFGVTAVAGVAEIGSPDPGLQPSGIFGAGFTVNSNNFAMEFDSDLYSWDSYSAPTGPGTGYWDAFIVTVSTSGYYWDLSPSDPVVSSPSTFVWGGTSYADGVLENYTTAPLSTDTISLNAGNATYYVSIVLDTKSLPDSDINHPSWGSFHVSLVPEPETYAMLLAGLGVLGFAGYRRKQVTAA
ncbi:MAG: PEP-CTERM sorting domain-containing protein [Nitrosomonas sp.]|nr:PEP-CTERM sorting domain-containing protein [Nitrosomonas sp.]